MEFGVSIRVNFQKQVAETKRKSARPDYGTQVHEDKDTVG
jgi:hypothetical protein